jgi:hypothetical protein
MLHSDKYSRVALFDPTYEKHAGTREANLKQNVR